MPRELGPLIFIHDRDRDSSRDRSRTCNDPTCCRSFLSRFCGEKLNTKAEGGGGVARLPQPSACTCNAVCISQRRKQYREREFVLGNDFSSLAASFIQAGVPRGALGQRRGRDNQITSPPLCPTPLAHIPPHTGRDTRVLAACNACSNIVVSQCASPVHLPCTRREPRTTRNAHL